MSFTDWLQQQRYTVVEVDPVAGRLRLREHGGACRDLSCQAETVVVGDDGQRSELDGLNPGDIVRMDAAAGRAERIVVVRRVWEELTSPEF
jgi:hypothetical protein